MHTIVIAKPGRLRDSLLLLLAMLPQIADVDYANDTPSLLDQIRKRPPDLVLMDTNLDHNGGLDTLRTLKSEAPRIPCLVIVSNAQQRSMARSAGADGFLLRGFSSMELAGEIRKLTN